MTNFLKSAGLRDLTTWHIANMTEQDCVDFFAVARWGSTSAQVCPVCGTVDSHYVRPSGIRWRCRHCDTDFSVLRGTVFQDGKLPYKKLLMALKLFCESPKGIAGHQLARNIGCQIKTAHALLGKLREALWRGRDNTKLRGRIHIDGGYFGGRPRKTNKRTRPSNQALADRVRLMHGDRTTARPKQQMTSANWRRRQNRRVVIVMREVSEDPGVGGLRTVTAVVPAEVEEFVLPLIAAFVEPGSEIMTDESPAYGRLGTHYNHKTVNHQAEFSTADGVQENQAEAFFSRLRRSVLGIVHRVTPKYLGDLANEMAWRDDVRRCTEHEKIDKILKAIFSTGLSRWWRGYWQNQHRLFDLTADHEIARALQVVQ